MNFTITTYSFSLPNLWPPKVTSSLLVLGFKIQPMKIQVAMDTTGIRM